MGGESDAKSSASRVHEETSFHGSCTYEKTSFHGPAGRRRVGSEAIVRMGDLSKGEFDAEKKGEGGGGREGEGGGEGGRGR